MMRHLFIIFVVLAVSPVFAADETLMAPLRTGPEGASADSLAAVLTEARRLGLPVTPIENKIREGIAKKRPAAEILSVVKIRSQCLKRIKEGNQGTMPKGYQQQLYAMEKERFARPPIGQEPKTAARVAERPSTSAKPLQMPRPIVPKSAQVPEAPKIKQEKEIGVDSTAVVQRALQKPGDKSEKALEKAGKKEAAQEKRIEKIERKNERKNKQL